jgi:ATP-dependent helicase HrpB
MSSFPVDPWLNKILVALETKKRVVLSARPGAGKTTRVSQALLLGTNSKRQIWVSQPRRLAARAAAFKVASDLGQEPGQSVGYQFRLEKKTSELTRLIFMTEGILINKILSDRFLTQPQVIVLDEFHERSLDMDLALAWCRYLQEQKNSPLKLMLMSATLDSTRLAGYLPGAEFFEIPGNLFEVETIYKPYESDGLVPAVKNAVRDFKSEKSDLLVFLPGRREMEKCREALGSDQPVSLLYSEMAVEEQQKVLNSESGRVILATNIAETSLTLPGVGAVIDSGLKREAEVDPWSQLPALKTVSISKASANQRAGRAGRTRAGKVIRLYSKFDFEHRANFDSPDILKQDLLSLRLKSVALGFDNSRKDFWLDAPPPKPWEKAKEILQMLGLENSQGITTKGKVVAGWPLSPRLACFLYEARSQRKDQLAWACGLAAFLELGKTSLPELWMAFDEFKEDNFYRREKARLINLTGADVDLTTARDEDFLNRILLSVFADLAAWLRPRKNEGKGVIREFLLTSGGHARLLKENEYLKDGWYVILKAQGLSESGKKQVPTARLVLSVKEEWLLDMDFFINEQTRAVWDESAEKVRVFNECRYGQVVLWQSQPKVSKQIFTLTAPILEKQIKQKNELFFLGEEEFESWLARADFAKKINPKLILDKLTFQNACKIIYDLCRQCVSFSEIEAARPLKMLLAQLDNDELEKMEEIAPASIKLPSGKKVKINYQSEKNPWVQSRIQDFFGTRPSLKIAQGKVDLILHLLAPNNRAVQVSSDLEGFWKREYPKLRVQLMRKYPRHFWPEDPANNRQGGKK